jgi:hypothetical protein
MSVEQVPAARGDVASGGADAFYQSRATIRQPDDRAEMLSFAGGDGRSASRRRNSRPSSRPPFVIAGDGGAERLARYRDGTILAAARARCAPRFLTTPPDEPIVILLFESDATYRACAKEWFGDTDVPHFGYFRRDNVMLMNVPPRHRHPRARADATRCFARISARAQIGSTRAFASLS